MATVLVVAYVIARAIREVRARDAPHRRRRRVVGRVPRVPAPREPRDRGPALRGPRAVEPVRRVRRDRGDGRAPAGDERGHPDRRDRHVGGLAARARLDAGRLPGRGRAAVRAVRAARCGATVPRRRARCGGRAGVPVDEHRPRRRGLVPLARAVAAVRRRLPAQPEPPSLPRVPDRAGARGGGDPVVPGPSTGVRRGDALDRRRARRVPPLPAGHGRPARAARDLHGRRGRRGRRGVGVRARPALGPGRALRDPGRRAPHRRDLVVGVPRRHRLPRPGDREPRRAGRRAAPVARRRRARVPLARADRPDAPAVRGRPTDATSPGSDRTRTSTRATCSPGRSRTGPRC